MEKRLAINLQLGERLLPDLVQWLLCRQPASGNLNLRNLCEMGECFNSMRL